MGRQVRRQLGRQIEAYMDIDEVADEETDGEACRWGRHLGEAGGSEPEQYVGSI